jgi:hypothetical protein
MALGRARRMIGLPTAVRGWVTLKSCWRDAVTGLNWRTEQAAAHRASSLGVIAIHPQVFIIMVECCWRTGKASWGQCAIATSMNQGGAAADNQDVTVVQQDPLHVHHSIRDGIAREM